MSIYKLLTNFKKINNLEWVDHLIYGLDYNLDHGNLISAYKQISLEGNSALLKKFLTNQKTKIVKLSVCPPLSARKGYIDLLIIFNNEKIIFDSHVYIQACKSGCLNILKWLDEETNYGVKDYTNLSPPLIQIVSTIAAKKGYLEILEYLWSKNQISYVLSFPILAKAASGGHLNIAKWIFEKFKQFEINKSMRSIEIVFNCRTSHVKYDFRENDFQMIGENGYIEIIEILINNLDFTKAMSYCLYILHGAISNNQKVIINFLMGKNVKPDEYSLFLASKNNDFDIFKLLHRKLSGNEGLIKLSSINKFYNFYNKPIKEGNYKFVKYLYDNGLDEDLHHHILQIAFNY